jgi:hypothetical protein
VRRSFVANALRQRVCSHTKHLRIFAV